jgi:radical SAM superfamily enzyme
MMRGDGKFSPQKEEFYEWKKKGSVDILMGLSSIDKRTKQTIRPFHLFKIVKETISQVNRH